MKRIPFLLITVGSLVLISANGRAQNDGLYTVVYQADRNGDTQSGDLSDLLAYVQQGNPIRIGYELVASFQDSTWVITHWADAGFITILGGHVFAQISGINSQGTSFDKSQPGVFLTNDGPNSWVAIIGTEGTLRSKFPIAEWMKGIPEEEIKAMEKMKVKTYWAVMKTRD